jgi:hypothetical protein
VNKITILVLLFLPKSRCRKTKCRKNTHIVDFIRPQPDSHKLGLGAHRKCFFFGQRPLVPLTTVHFFPIILFGSTTLLTRMTGSSLHVQWPLTSQLHGSVSQREQLFFCYGSNSTPFPTADVRR